MIDYSPLWETMARKGITQYQILKDKVIDNKTLDSLKKGKNITLLSKPLIVVTCFFVSCIRCPSQPAAPWVPAALGLPLLGGHHSLIGLRL